MRQPRCPRFSKKRNRSTSRTNRRPISFSVLESLEARAVPAIVAAFSPTFGALMVFGDANDNTMTVSRNAAGGLLVDGGTVAIKGGTPTVANTSSISIFGFAGNDTLALDETNGALPMAVLVGGAGNDTLTGGSGADFLFGQAGNDTLLGKGGNDLLFGGDGNDVLIGGVGNDQVFGEGGDDRLIWNPGDGTDLNEGGAGNDTVEVNGGNGAETFSVTANGTRVRFDRLNPAPFSLDIGTTEHLVLNANGGDDSVTAGNGLAPLIQLTIDGGPGNDSIQGGDGNDVLIGGDGNDVISGGRGNDSVFLGAGDDTFVWNPGDGSDTVEGQGGFDTMQFNGSNANENIGLSANGSRLRFARNVGNVVMDTNDVERVNFVALGGSDNITVGDLSATSVKEFNVDLAATPGDTSGDGQFDSLTLNGSNQGEMVNVLGANRSIAVTGLPTSVTVNGVEATDALNINGNGGNDTISASTLATPVALTVDGGAGNDMIVGSNFADTLIGGDGSDFVVGGRGNDVAILGAGDDVFVWNPGDGSDTIEGQAGSDQMLFNGANVSENIDISANGSRLRFTRDVGNVTLDANGIEQVAFNALGGLDTVTVNDLSGTDVKLVQVNLSGGSGGAGDGNEDHVVVNGTAGADNITAATTAGVTMVSGLAAQVRITGIDAGIDRLDINGLAGADRIDASGLTANLLKLTLQGGDGDDLLIGSAGDDVVIGGRGNDTAFLGAGDDVFVWNPGDGSDTIEGQAGTDQMLFNGANVSENIDISANGSRLRFTRDVGNVTMDANGIEQVAFNALGGADTITVHDLSGTDVTDVQLDLASPPGSQMGDGQADQVVVEGTNGDDAIVVFGSGPDAQVTGLSANVAIHGIEPTLDRLQVNGLGGDDVLDASSVAAAAIQIGLDGGAGNDILLGGSGNDVLSGGDGDDVLIGGPGIDLLDGGPGNNILIQ